MPVKNCLKKMFINSSLPKVLLKSTVSESLFEMACNFVRKGTVAQLFSYEFYEFSGRLLLSTTIKRQEHIKLNGRKMRATIF